MALPLILAGPIVRRVEPRLASVWVALSKAKFVELDIWSGIVSVPTDREPDYRSTTQSIRVGENLYIAVATAEIPELTVPLLPNSLYSYNLKLKETFDGNTGEDLRSLGLLEDRAAKVENGRLVVKPHLALGYASNELPTFALPPHDLTHLRILHGSCRRPNCNAPDAMPWIDDLIRESRTDPLKRPHQLMLTGDQIYADDVAAPMLYMLINAGNMLVSGIDPTAPAADTDRIEHLPTRWPLKPSDAGVRVWPADHAHFPAGLRKYVVKHDARLTTVDLNSHLLSLGEFCAMYLFCWANEAWPDSLPTLEQWMKPLSELPFDGTGPFELALWRLHTGLDESLKDEKDKLCKKTLINFKMRDFIKCVCIEKRADFFRDLQVLTEFRAGLTKVRRALANVPTYMTFDDHEVTDDWYMNPMWRDQVLTAPLGRTLVRNSLLAYAVCQGWGNDPRRFYEDLREADGQMKAGPHKQLLLRLAELFPPNETLPPNGDAANAIDTLLGLDGKDPPVTWHYAVPGQKHLILALDCRTRRSFAGRVSAPGNVGPKALEQQVPPPPPAPGVEVLFVVSSLTVLGPPVIDELLGPVLYRAFDLQHGNTAAMPGTNPDAIEAWPYVPETLEALLKRLEPYRRVVILSGDVHFAASTAMSYWKKGDTVPARFAQFTASAMRNLFKEEIRVLSQNLAFMQHVIRSEISAERLGWNKAAENLLSTPAGERPRAALRDRLRRSPVLLPTEGWPRGTKQRDDLPPDWAWHVTVKFDERADLARPPAARPEPLVADNAAADIAPDLDGYRASAIRHVKQLDNMNHDRQMLFATNFGVVRFERRENRERGEPVLVAVHELYTTHPKALLPERAEVYAYHEVELTAAPAQPPRIGR